MNRFSELIEQKSNLLKVKFKVDPAFCKNGEITQVKEYSGYVISERKFDKKCEELFNKYGVQKEGAVLNTLKKNITDPFKSSEFNPFVGNKSDEKDSTEKNKEFKTLTQTMNAVPNKNKQFTIFDNDSKKPLGAITYGQFITNTQNPNTPKPTDKDFEKIMQAINAAPDKNKQFTIIDNDSKKQLGAITYSQFIKNVQKTKPTVKASQPATQAVTQPAVKPAVKPVVQPSTQSANPPTPPQQSGI